MGSAFQRVVAKKTGRAEMQKINPQAIVVAPSILYCRMRAFGMSFLSSFASVNENPPRIVNMAPRS